LLLLPGPSVLEFGHGRFPGIEAYFALRSTALIMAA